MLAFIVASALGASRLYPLQAAWIMRKMYAFAIGLLPLTLCFWAYRTIGDFSHPRVYFTYDNALFFMSDALVAFAVLLWLTVKIAQGSNIMNGRFQGIGLILIFLFVFVLPHNCQHSLVSGLAHFVIYLPALLAHPAPDPFPGGLEGGVAGCHVWLMLRIVY